MSSRITYVLHERPLTLREYLSRCILLVNPRHEPSSYPPQKLKPDASLRRLVGLSKRRVEEAKALSLEQASQIADAEFTAATARWQEALSQRCATMARYHELLAQLDAWQATGPAMAEFKGKVSKHLADELLDPAPKEPIRLTPEQYRQQRIDWAEDQLQRRKVEYAEHLAMIRNVNAIIDAIREL